MSVVPIGYANEYRSFFDTNVEYFQSSQSSFTIADNNNVVPIALPFIKAGVQYQVAYQVEAATDNATPAPLSTISFSVGDVGGVHYPTPDVLLINYNALLATNPILFQSTQIYTAITDGTLDTNLYLNRDVGDANVYTAVVTTWVRSVGQNLPF